MVMNFKKEPWKKEVNDDETWIWKKNMECEKLILVRSTKSTFS
jgi:hypothetical protein